MAGLLDFLFQGGQGGGLLGGMGGQQMAGAPMQISPGPQQQMLNVPNAMPQQSPSMAGSLDPSFFANQVRQNQQPPGLLFGADSGLLGGLRGALNQIGDPQGQRQQQAIQNYLAVKAAEEKPQYQVIEDPNTGIKRMVQIQPFGRGVTYVNPTEPGGASAAPGIDPSIPPGADVKTVREKRGAAAVANEEDAVKSAKAAADFQPIVDQAVSAYERAIKAGAIGPLAASSVMRANEKYNPLASYIVDPEREKARQDYDIAKAALQARITAAQNKGEGQVSNFERQMYAAQFPDLQSLEPQKQLEYLKQIQAQTKQTVGAGRIPGIGQAPQVGAVLSRPTIGGLDVAPAAGTPPATPQAAPMRVQNKSAYDALPSGASYIAPDGSLRTKR